MVQCVRQLQNKFIKKLSDNFCTDFWNKVIMNLSTITELTESTVTLLVEHIRACVKMLHDSLTGHPPMLYHFSTDITVLKPGVLNFTAKAFCLLESILKQCQSDQLENCENTNLKYVSINFLFPYSTRYSVK